MALQTSGPISLSDIAGEFGGNQPHKLSEYYDADSGVPRSGTISFSDFYGKSNISGPVVVFSISPTSYTAGGSEFKTFDITVSAGNNVSWSSTDNTNWIEFANGGTGTGNGVISVVLDANNTRSSRTGEITVTSSTGLSANCTVTQTTFT